MNDVVREWIDKAEGDYRTAMREAQADPANYDAVCFHAQQCIDDDMKKGNDRKKAAGQRSSLSKARTYAEIGAFWDEHDPSYPGQPLAPGKGAEAQAPPQAWLTKATGRSHYRLPTTGYRLLLLSDGRPQAINGFVLPRTGNCLLTPDF